MDCTQYIRGYILIVILALLSACGGGSDDPPIPPVTTSTGVFVDGIVVGFHYETPTFSGTTNNAIVRFLLTLDDDGNPDNGITISAAVTAAAAGLSVDFTIADLSTDTGVIALLAALPGPPTLVDSTVAQTHFTEILATTWGIMSWGSGTVTSEEDMTRRFS